MLYFKLNAQKAFLVEDFEEISSQEALALPLAPSKQTSHQYPLGIMGLLSYDDYSANTYPEASKTASRFFRIKKMLPLAKDFPWKQFARILDEESENGDPIILDAQISDTDYLAKCTVALEEIRSGRFYQINLLRYFKARHAPSLKNLAKRMERFAGPFGCWFELYDLRLISFTPECFIKVEPQNAKLVLKTFPIKGTCKSNPTDLKADGWQKEQLLSSPKNLAELHMIVDLMRHDLQKIAVPGTVEVLESERLKSFAQVHHLQAILQAEIKSHLTLGELFRALCPAGSITGAPKIEVMKAIAELENRPRGWFMGHAFYFHPGEGQLQANILIRTLTHAKNIGYEFAAGSGIVIRSDPQLELSEINDKCGVLSSPV